MSVSRRRRPEPRRRRRVHGGQPGLQLRNTGQWTFQGADQGFWDIDLWIGGLAERPLFDGRWGHVQLRDPRLRPAEQDGDRFYYLYRTPMGTHLGNEIIENQFANLVMEQRGSSTLNGEIFIWSNQTYDLELKGPTHFNAATNRPSSTSTAIHTLTMPASAGTPGDRGERRERLHIGWPRRRHHLRR